MKRDQRVLDRGVNTWSVDRNKLIVGEGVKVEVD